MLNREPVATGLVDLGLKKELLALVVSKNDTPHDIFYAKKIIKEHYFFNLVIWKYTVSLWIICADSDRSAIYGF